jgi:hypothetical protein
MAASKRLQTIKDRVKATANKQVEKIEQVATTATKKSTKGVKPFVRDYKKNLTKEQCRFIQHLGYEFRRNVVRSAIEVRRMDGPPEWTDLDDTHVDDIWIEFEISDEFKASKDKPGQARIYSLINTKLLSKPYSPVEQYLKALKWDGKDHIAALADTVSVLDDRDNDIKASEYWKPFLRRWMLAAVQCSMGIKENQVMLTLVGAQGRGKTTWLNRLCPPELSPGYIHIGHIEPTLLNNETCNILAEKVICNIDDQLEQIFGKDYNALKSTISIKEVSNRKSYERRGRTRARLCNFVGSVNERHLFHDLENRRYLTFEISKINSYHKVDMSQVWAQAYEAFMKGEQAYFSPEEVAVINAINTSFAVPMEEQEWFQRLYDPLDEKKHLNGTYMMATEMLAYMQKASGMRMRTWRFTNIVLRRLGLEQVMRRTIAGPRYVYYVRLKYALVDGRVVLAEELPDSSSSM